jgi:hypothetical protein
MCSQYTLTIFTPFFLLPHLLPLLFRTISTGFTVPFSKMNKKYIYYIQPPSSAPLILSLPTGAH